MGHLYAENGNIEAAHEHWEQSHKLYIKVNDIEGRNTTKMALKSIK